MKVYEEIVTFVPKVTISREVTKQDTDDELNIRWHSSLETAVQGSSICSLSWGLDRELLVGNERLTLFHPPSASTRSGTLRSSWSFALSTKVKDAQFSPDASFIASHGSHDRLVKIWRRLTDRVSSTGQKTSDFDFIYLPHTRSVHVAKWRQPFYEDLLVDNIVYTTSLDLTLRAWASDIPHDGHLLTLHESIPLKSERPENVQLSVVLDDDVLSWALAKALKRNAGSEDHAHAAELLSEISKGQPEVVLNLSLDGEMSAYALHNLGNRNHKPSSQKLFFKTTNLKLIRPGDDQSNTWITATVQRVGDCDLLFVIGRNTSISLYQVDLFNLFSEDVGNLRFEELMVLTGHAREVAELRATRQGLVTSKSESGEELIWQNLAGHLSIVPQTECRSEEYLNGHSVPEYLPAPNTASLTSMSGPYVAVVDSGQLTAVQIWGPELSTSFSGAPETLLDLENPIVALNWNTSTDETPILCVCTSQSLFLVRARIIAHENMQRWSIFWTFNISSITQHQITHAVFSSDELLMVSAGAQIFTFSAFDWGGNASRTSSLTQSLPVYHPMYLEVLLSMGKLDGARLILLTLHDQLVNSHETVRLEDNLGLSEAQIFNTSKSSQAASAMAKDRYNALFNSEAESELDQAGVFSHAKAASLNSLLADLEIPNLEIHHKENVAIIASALVRVQSEESSLDDMGLRFYLSYIILQERNLRDPAALQTLSDKDALWAYKSDKQDILLTLVKSSVKSLTWETAKSAKIFYWLKDRTALLELTELIAKAEFLKGEDRDPVAASLWYLALHKKSVLLSLWRTSGAHPEHNLTTKILNSDFEAPKWRTTANKNAFALIGKRRYQYAAAWFLLGSSLKDAVSVCIRNLQDLDLALAISRTYSSDNSITTRTLVSSDIFNSAKAKGSRLLGCWCHEFLGDVQASFNCLVSPFSLYTKDSPELSTLYLSLRTRLGAHEREIQFVEYLTYLLTLRGCATHAKYFSETWTHERVPDKTSGGAVMVVGKEETTVEEYIERRKEKLGEAPKAVFEEPTMDSFAAFDF